MMLSPYHHDEDGRRLTDGLAAHKREDIMQSVGSVEIIP